MVMNVLDRAIQIHGSLGRHAAGADVALQPHAPPRRRPGRGPQDVLARRELNRWSKRAEAEASGEPRHAARMV
jgi:hypothetical protein